MLDQLTDTRHRLLVEIAQDRPDLVPRFKTASLNHPGELPLTAFADQGNRRFPIHTEEHAVLSKLYAEKQASEVSRHTLKNIDTALSLYGHNPGDFSFPPREKQASSVKSSQYLLPQYERLCVRGKNDVKPSTEALLSQRHRLKVASLTEASVRAVKLAAEHGLNEDDMPRDIFKYAGLTTCDAGELLDWIEARAVACTDFEKRKNYDKIAQVVEKNFPRDGILRDRNELVKIASAIEKADKKAGLTPLYGRQLLDPVKSVFNMDKIAEPTVDLGGQQIPLLSLLSVPPEVYEEILGEGVIDTATGSDGQVDAEQFHALLQTLPADLKTLLASTLAPHLSA